jgi:hypothetical protein
MRDFRGLIHLLWPWAAIFAFFFLLARYWLFAS